MKRILTSEEVNSILDFEDSCGCCNLIQEISYMSKEFGENIVIVGDIDEEGRIGKVEVVERSKYAN
jgi:hypothetical protein